MQGARLAAPIRTPSPPRRRRGAIALEARPRRITGRAATGRIMRRPNGNRSSARRFPGAFPPFVTWGNDAGRCGSRPPRAKERPRLESRSPIDLLLGDGRAPRLQEGDKMRSVIAPAFAPDLAARGCGEDRCSHPPLFRQKKRPDLRRAFRGSFLREDQKVRFTRMPATIEEVFSLARGRPPLASAARKTGVPFLASVAT